MNARRIRRYVLDEKGEARPEPNFLRWVKWCRKGKGSLIVASDLIEGTFTIYEVDTLFLTFDRGGENDPPIVFATSVFPLRGPQPVVLAPGYSSRVAAIVGHHDTIKTLKDFQLKYEEAIRLREDQL